MALFAAAAAVASAARADGGFLADLRKAQSRSDPSERAEYYSRAVAAWKGADGDSLLAAARFGRGQAEYELDLPQDAAADLSQALELDPNNDAVYLLRGEALLRLGRSAQAARDLSTYVSLRPRDEEGWLALGEARGGDIAAYRQAARLAPSDLRPAVKTAQALAAARRYELALQTLPAGARSAQALAARAWSEAGLERPVQALADADAAARGFEEELGAMRRGLAAPVELHRVTAEADRNDRLRRRLRERVGAAQPAPRRKTKIKSGAGDRIYAN